MSDVLAAALPTILSVVLAGFAWRTTRRFYAEYVARWGRPERQPPAMRLGLGLDARDVLPALRALRLPNADPQLEPQRKIAGKAVLLLYLQGPGAFVEASLLDRLLNGSSSDAGFFALWFWVFASVIVSWEAIGFSRPEFQAWQAEGARAFLLLVSVVVVTLIVALVLAGIVLLLKR